MGKNIIYTYSCDNCKADFKSPDEVLSVDGKIVNGEGQPLFTDMIKSTDVLCKKCFISIIKEQVVCGIIDAHEIVEEATKNKEETLQDIEYTALRKIENKEDEDIFIEYLGHISRENFTKIYSKSLIGCYYPVDDAENIPFINFNDICSVNLIYKAFAGIPQIKKVDVYLINSTYAFTNKSVLTDN